VATIKLVTANAKCWPDEDAACSSDYRKWSEVGRSLANSTGWRQRPGLFSFPLPGRGWLRKPCQLVYSVLAEAFDLFASISSSTSGRRGH
jgi:hypothetical protein